MGNLDRCNPPRRPKPPIYGLVAPTVPGRKLNSTAYAIEDPDVLTRHWGLDTCVSAGFINLRLLIFTRNINVIRVDFCRHIQPMGYDDSYTLIEYLPVTDVVIPNLSSKKNREISCVTPAKYNVGVFENNLPALVVDVRVGRTVASGHAVELLDFDTGALTFRLNIERSSEASYEEFLRMIAGEPIQPVEPAPETPLEILEDIVDGEGFYRIY